jgi:hypothetical protein
MKKSLVLSKSTALLNDKDTNNSNLPNQYARVKNIAKGEDVIKDNTDQTYAFVDEFLKNKLKGRVFMKQIMMLIMNIGHQTKVLMQHLA